MTSVIPSKAWDFSAVYSLLDTLSEDSTPNRSLTPTKSNKDIKPSESPPRIVLQKSPRNDASLQSNKDVPKLGDFTQLWQFLGTPPPIRQHVVNSPQTSPTLYRRIPVISDYASDGALCHPSPSTKKLQWRDEVEDGTLTDVAPGVSDNNEPAKLTKKQRHKLNRRRRLEEAAEARRAVSDMESEAEMPMTFRNPAAKASIHSIPVQSTTQHVIRPKIDTTPQSSPEQHRKSSKKQESVVAVPFSDTTNLTAGRKSEGNDDALRAQVVEAGRKVLARYTSEPRASQAPASTQKVVKKEWPVSKPYNSHALTMLPASVRPSRSPASSDAKHAKGDLASSSPPKATGQVQSWTSPSKPNTRITIQPITIRPPEERHWALLLKLINRFWADKRYLVAPANLSNHSRDPAGIHVFVDASNILIGFHDALKRARNIPAHVRVPRVDISFDSLALLLERRRPVAKRVLAGSTPHVAAFDVAAAIGYECCILDKVYKARELTDRQRYFMAQDAKKQQARRRSSSSRGGGGESEADISAGSVDSADEAKRTTTTTPTHAPEKFVEQGVDEILHLKILESLVDVTPASEGASTIVLATGDAAKAEYSGGFMRMAERALEKGWKVELVSWRANVSQLYLRKEWRARWRERFVVVELDEWVEEMLEM